MPIFSNQLISDLCKLVGHLSSRRRRQLLQLLVLVSLSAISEVLSLGAVIPFLGALSDSSAALKSKSLSPFISFLNIQNANQLIIWSSIVFVTTVFLASVLRLTAIWARDQLTAQISTELSQTCYKNTILQPYSFYLNHNSSDLITAAKDYLDGTIQVVQSCLTFGSYCIVFVSVFMALLAFDWQITIILVFLISAIMGSLTKAIRRSLRNDSLRIVLLARKRVELIQITLGGIRDIILDNSQYSFVGTYSKIDKPIRFLQAKRVTLSGLTRPLLETSVLISLVGLILFKLSKNGTVADVLPVLGGFALGANRMLPAVQQCFSAWTGIQGYCEHLSKFLITLDRKPIQVPLEEEHSPLELVDELSLEDVWFRYKDNSEWVLSGLNLKIPAFSTVGFIGSSGCGKTTASDIILGLLKPQKGKLIIDGTPILDASQNRAWRSMVAHVPQSIYLSDATIAENIAFGVPLHEVDWTRLESSAQLAQIHNFIEKLPNGYHEVVGERGIRLSGGQRQRIGIARALYKQASVIVFDEATSALDSQTESDLMDSIYSLSSSLTIILIAHRVSTLNRCDYVFNFEHGHIRKSILR